jgi:hypothetical protein
MTETSFDALFAVYSFDPLGSSAMLQAHAVGIGQRA